jgi:hypothetical protein
MSDYPVHPACEVFPLIEGAEFAELVEDVRKNGLVEPIVQTADGRILDGRNRLRACEAAGVEPIFATYHGADPWGRAFSLNVTRRQLTDGQRAMVAARYAIRSKGEHNRWINEPGGAFTSEPPPPTRAQAAEMLNVKERTVERGRAVVNFGTAALNKLASDGKVPLSTASRIARKASPEQQNEFAEKVTAGARVADVTPPVARHLYDRVARRANQPVPAQGAGYVPARYRFIRWQAVENTVHALRGLRTVLAETERQLHPSITPADADRALADIGEVTSSLTQLKAILRERRDQESDAGTYGEDVAS